MAIPYHMTMAKSSAPLKIEYVAPKTLVAAGYNPRTITEAQREALRLSVNSTLSFRW